MHVRLLPTYVFHRRMYSPDVRVLDARVLSTYVLYQRTCSADVHASTTYVFETARSEIEIRDYASGNRDTGLRIWRWIRDYAEHSGSDEEDHRGLVFRP